MLVLVFRLFSIVLQVDESIEGWYCTWGLHKTLTFVSCSKSEMLKTNFIDMSKLNSRFVW